MPIRSKLDGYPIFPGGSKKLSVYDFKGLAVYTPGGETIRARQLGESAIDAVIPQNIGRGSVTQGAVARDETLCLSFSGTYFVTFTFAAGAKGAVESVTIKWYVTATGAECGAIDLSAETVRAAFLLV